MADRQTLAIGLVGIAVVLFVATRGSGASSLEELADQLGQETEFGVASGGDPGPEFNQPVRTFEEALEPIDQSNLATVESSTGTDVLTWDSAQRVAVKSVLGMGEVSI